MRILYAGCSILKPSEIVCNLGGIVYLLNKYVSEKMYTFVDKILRAHRPEEVIQTFGELLRDASGRFPQSLPSTDCVSLFYDLVKEDITIAHIVAGAAYTYLDNNFFENCVKGKRCLEYGGEV